MSNEHCLPQIHGCAIRVTRLEANGVPDPGADNLIVSDALTTLTITPVYSDGDEIEQKNACGNVCINFQGDDSFKRADLELTICTHDPFLMEMLVSGSDVLTDGARRGWAAPPIGPITGNGVSIEVWAKRIDSDGTLDVDAPYAWWVLPRVKNLRHGARSFANEAALPTFTGRAVENPNWYDGPLNDWPAASDRAYQWIEATSIPAASCGYQTVAVS